MHSEESPAANSELCIKILVEADSIVIGFHSWIFLQSEETEGANSKLFKEDVDDAMYKNPYEI